MSEKKRIITQGAADKICAAHQQWSDGKEGEMAVFEGCRFEGVSFAGKALLSAYFTDCEFADCDLTNTDLGLAQLENVRFENCCCKGMVIEKAKLLNVNFTECDVGAAKICNNSVRELSFEDCGNVEISKCRHLPIIKVKNIEAESLRNMDKNEGLIIQGCGGDVQEWADGINSMLNNDGVFTSDKMFSEIYRFENEKCTCLMFPFKDTALDAAKLAVWRLETHDMFGGTWLSDYVPNRLGGFLNETQEREKPMCPLIGSDGNIFALLGTAAKTLKQNGMADEAKEMSERVMKSGSYSEALNTIGEYVDICSAEDMYAEDTMEFEGGM